MEWISLGAVVLAGALGAAEPAADAPQLAPTFVESCTPIASCCETLCAPCCRQRKPFESDHCFDGFIGPISNPVFSKDPRTLTEARILLINNWIDKNHVLGFGANTPTYQVYAMQVRVALTDRLSLIADKDGYGVFSPSNVLQGGAGGNGDEQDGWLNIAAGLKYNLIRDVERQFLASVGFMYEFQTGEAEVFQSHGSGFLTLFGTAGKELSDGKTHFLATVGQTLPFSGANSGFFYSQLHLDRQFLGWLYPLVELNWYHYTRSGNRGLPATVALPNGTVLNVGEGDGHVNLGTSDVTGNDLVTIALGAKAKLGAHIETGLVWEAPISNRKDLIDNRVTAELILRY